MLLEVKHHITGDIMRTSFTNKASLLVLLACLGLQAHAADDAAKSPQASVRHKVVFQVSDNDPKKWELALNNVRNIQADLGQANTDIEVVAYGPGLAMLKADSVVAQRIHETLGTHAKVVACENTMRAQHVTKDDMLPSIGYVASGVVEIMRRQENGSSYVRP
jgi:intracellular sulfur oxidation DsrE/DsrF family protein